MQRWHTLEPYLPLLPASGLASCHNSSQPWGVWELGLPVRICYCAGTDSLILDTKTTRSKEDEGKLQIVAISITIIFLPPKFVSLYFYSFPNPQPPLPHFHRFPSTTTITTTINTTYLRNLFLCISFIINIKKQRRKIKNVVFPGPDNSTC